MDQMTDSEMDHQRHGYYHSEPCIYFGGTNISQPNIHTMVTTSSDNTNIDSHYLLDAYDNNMMYGATEYTSIQHQHQRDPDMGIPVATNLYYTGMIPSSSSGVLPLPPNHRASDQSSGSSAFAVSGAYKRKNVEGIGGNYQYFNASTSSSSVSPPPTARHTEGIAMMDTTSYPLTQFRGTGIPSCVEVGPYGTSSWSRPGGESVILHDHNHLFRGNYPRQHFQSATPHWMDQHLSSNNNDGHARAWNQPLPMPCVQAPNADGCLLENTSMGLQRYHHDTTGNRSGLRLPHPTPVNPHHLNFHHPTLTVQGTRRGHSINFHPAVTAASYRVPANHSRSATIPTQTGFEMGVRHVGPVPSTGLRIYRPHRGGISETTLGHQNLPPMGGFLQVDDLPLLVDNHRDMRLDIEDMSYEELLALGERIGNVSTGSSEEMIMSQMKTKTYVIPAAAINLEEVASEEQETDSCIICQDEFKSREKIGVLECGHEYHADCLRKWLLVKNVCPICKSQAFTPGRKGV